MTQPAMLEFTIDKFTFRVPQDRLYSHDDCWVVLLDDRHVRIGLTDFRQQASGDLAFVELPPAGLAVTQGQDMITLETIKVTFSVPAPLSGTITAVNTALESQPELVNQDPYGEGWLVDMLMSVPTQKDALLSPADYFGLMQTKAEKERSKT